MPRPFSPRPISTRRAILAASVLAITAPCPLRAAVLTWDASKNTPTAPVDSSGSWDNSTKFWSTLADPTGQSPNAPTDVAWSAGSTAIFGNGGGSPNKTTNSNITITSTSLSVGDIIFGALAVGSAPAFGTDYQISGNPINLAQQNTTITIDNVSSQTLATIPDAEITSQIKGNSNITITGPGALHIGNLGTGASANNYTGTTTIATAVYVGNANLTNVRSSTAVTTAFGAAGNTVVLSNGTIVNNSTGNGVSLPYSFSIPANTTNTITGSKTSVTSLGGTSGLSYGTTTGSGTLTFNLGATTDNLYSDYSTFAGTLTLNGGGTLKAFANNGAFVGGSGMTLDLESTDANPTTFSPQTVPAGNQLSFGALTSATASAVLNGSSSGMVTYSLGALGSNTTFAGAIGSGSNTNAAVIKVGSGALTLINSNPYIGPTTVSNGMLIVNGSITSSTVAIASAGTLAGIGTLGAAVIDNGTINPGDTGAGSIGQMTFSSDLTLATGATYAVDFGATGSDSAAVAGNLLLGSSDTLTLSALDGTAAGIYTIAIYVGTLTGTFANVPANATVNYGSRLNGAIVVTIVPTPEPASVGILAAGMSALLARRRKIR